MQFTISTEKESAESKAVSQMLDAFNLKHAGPYNEVPLNIFIKDDDGKVLGGLIGITYWGWLYIDSLVISDELRGTGLGTILIEMAEEEAKKRGCRGVHLDTHDFQAPGFYEKFGYRYSDRMPNLPERSNKYQLMKEFY